MQESVTFQDVSFSFSNGRESIILERLSFHVPRGRIVGIVGPSGVGKTTLLRLTGGLLVPAQGTILVGGLDAVTSRKKRQVAYAPQRGALCSWLSTVANVELALRLCGHDGDVSEQSRKLLVAFSLEKDLKKYPQQLSGGMQQRVILAMALGSRRPLVLLDEPFISLDAYTRSSLYKFLLDEWENEPVRSTVLVVSHDLGEAAYLCDQVLVLAHRPLDSVVSVEIPLPRPRTSSMRYDTPYLSSVRRMEELLNHA